MVLLTLVPGCSSGRLESSITSVSPDELFSGRETQLTMSGRFYSQLTLNSLTGQTSESWAYSGSLVWLEGPEPVPTQKVYPLNNLTATSSTLTALVKEGLPPGQYGLALLDPAGYAVEVAAELVITVPDRQADHIALSSTSRFMLAGGTLEVSIQVVYPDSSPAAGAWDVELRLSNTAATFVTSTLTDPVQQTVEESNGSRKHELRGKVDANGFATVTLSNPTVESFTLNSYSPDLNHFIADSALELVVLPTGYVGLSVVIPKDSSLRDPCLETEVEADDAPHRPTGQNIAVMVEAVDASGARVEVESAFELLDVEDEGPAPYFPPTLNLGLTQGCWDGILIYEAPKSTWLLAVGPDATYGFSPELVIETGPARAYDLRLESGRTSVEAGVPFTVIALQHDGYDNPVVFTEGLPLPTLTETTGTLTCAAIETAGAEAHFVDCVITESTPQTELLANNGAGASGTLSLPVQPGPPAAIAVEGPETSIPAGTQQTFTLQLQDAYGNDAQDLSGAALLEVQLVGLEGPEGDPQSLDLIRGTAQLTLTLTKSGTWKLDALLPSLGIFGESDWFDVVPAALSGFRVTPCPASGPPCPFTAGISGQVLVQALDAFGNLTGVDPGPIELRSPLEALKPDPFTVEGLAEGQGTLTVTLTVASSYYTLEAILLADQAVAGESPPFEVKAGEMDHYRIETPQPVYWTSEVFEVRVLAVDFWENLVTSVRGMVLLTDQTNTLALEGQSFPGAQAMVQLEAGETRARLLISTVKDTDWLTANGLGFKGRSSDFAVYNRQCTTSLTVNMTANGNQDAAVACIVERPGGDNVPASVTFAGTASEPVSAVVWDVGDSLLKTTDKLVPYTYAYQSPGRTRATLYALDKNLCAARDSLFVYTNFDNQSPAGPLLMTAQQDPLLAGSLEGSSQTLIEVQAYDCQGDQAVAPFVLTLQTTLGQVLTPDSDPDIPGVQVALNSRISAETSFAFGVSEERFSGTAQVLVSTPNSTATGSLAISVLNDLTPPFVIGTAPSGETRESVSEIRIRFSEPLRGGSALLTPEIQVESDVQGPLTISERSNAQDPQVLSLMLSSPLTWDSGAETITVTLPSAKGLPSLTDVEGNRLDGNWNGVADADDPFVFRFGSALHPPAAASILDCVVVPGTFSPDGQDGPGAEADQVRMDVYYQWEALPRAAGLLLLSTYDGSTSSVMLTPFTDPGPDPGSTLSWSWNGVDLLGYTLRNGGYRLVPLLLDDADNWIGLKCTVEETQAMLINSIDVGGVW